jgi:ZIP family zinc transporter
MIVILGLATVFSTLLGGLFALYKKDKLHLILGFSAGAVVGVAFFDLLPESFSLATPQYAPATVTAVMAVGFLFFMLLSRFLTLVPEVEDDTNHHHSQSANLGAGTLSIHSFLDGMGIGLAFQVSPTVGMIVAVAVLAHDFSDGINTVGYILKYKGKDQNALRWLVVDALAPLFGIVVTYFFTLTSPQLGLILALFCGFFLYIGASDLLPESQHRHPKLVTSLMTIFGALVIFTALKMASL